MSFLYLTHLVDLASTGWERADVLGLYPQRFPQMPDASSGWMSISDIKADILVPSDVCWIISSNNYRLQRYTWHKRAPVVKCYKDDLAFIHQV